MVHTRYSKESSAGSGYPFQPLYFLNGFGAFPALMRAHLFFAAAFSFAL